MRILSEKAWWKERGITRIGGVNMKWIGELGEVTNLASGCAEVRVKRARLQTSPAGAHEMDW